MELNETSDNISVSITNENYKEMGTKIAKALRKAFGGLDAFFKFNLSKGKYNKHGCRQVVNLRLPELEFFKFVYSIIVIKYDGTFYQGYIQTRGVEISNLRVLMRDDVEVRPSDAEALKDELYVCMVFIEEMAKLTNEVEPLNCVDSMFEYLPRNSSFIRFNTKGSTNIKNFIETYNQWDIYKEDSTIYHVSNCTIRFSSIESARDWIDNA